MVLRDEVKRLSRSGLDWRTFADRAATRLAGLVGCETWCVATADPATLLMTGVTADAPVGSPARFFELEYGIDEPFSQQSLARGPVRVDALSRATDGHLERSQRWRELLEPLGFGDWLRGALVTNDGCWGYVAMMRDRRADGFAPADVELVARVGSAMADGLRTARHLGQASLEHRVGSGLVLLDAQLALVERSPGAAELLEGEAWHAVLAIAARAKGSRVDDEHAVVVRAPSGWTRLVAMRLHADGDHTDDGRADGDGASSGAARIAVIAHPAGPPDATQLLSSQYGLSAREHEVTRAVAAGNSTAEIADLLHISQFTVQQHLKSIFDKVGVRSRRELVGLIFQQRFLPALD